MRLDTFMNQLLSHSSQLPSQPRLGPDAGEPQPGETAGESRTFQALGVPSRTTLVPPMVGHPFGQDVRAPASEQLGSAASFGSGCRSSASQAPPHPPPRYEDPPPQPSTSGWVPPGPPPTRPRRDSHSSSESEASEAESDVSFRDSASSRLADLTYEVCPDSRPLIDTTRAPRCGFEVWFGQPEATASKHGSGSTLASRRCSQRLLLGLRLWLVAPNLSLMSSPHVRVDTPLRMIPCSPRPIR